MALESKGLLKKENRDMKKILKSYSEWHKNHVMPYDDDGNKIDRNDRGNWTHTILFIIILTAPIWVTILFGW